MRPTVHVVPHTHWDREWYHQASRFQLRLARVVDAAMALIEKDKLPVFLLDGQGIVLDDYLAVRPGSLERLVNHLAGGRLECGPWYVLADNLLVSGEALVRNLLEGGRAVRRYGGKPMRVGYAPDTFGHPAILPTLFAGFGIHNAVTWRGFGGERGQDKDIYRWVGPDGSEAIMIHLPPQGYENGANLPAEPASARERWRKIRAVVEGRARSPHWLVMNGADHHIPQPDLRQAVKSIAGFAPDCSVEIGSLADYCADVEKWAQGNGSEIPRLTGELRHGRRSQWVLQGTHTARIHLKQSNAKCQRLLERYAEPLAALSLSPGASRFPPPDSRFPALADDLHAAWRVLLENHPHDSICGTSADQVHREMVTRFERSRTMGDEIAMRALDALTSHDADAARLTGRESWQPGLVLFNPSPSPRGGVVIAEVALFKGDVRVGQQGTAGDQLVLREPGELVIRDTTGKALPFQELNRRSGYDLIESARYYPDDDAVEWRRVAIAVPELPALGTMALRVEDRTEGTAPGSRLPSLVGVSEFGLTNDRVWLRVDADGTISASQRSADRSVHRLGGIETVVDEGDSYTSSPRGQNLTKAPDHVAVRVLHGGPLVGELEVLRRYDAANLEVVMRVRLDADSPLIRFDFTFHNRAPQRRVRASFPLERPLAAVVADGPFGPVERAPWPPKKKRGDVESPEAGAPMLRYVTVASPRDALTVFADGLPNYEARPNGTVLVTLMRSFTELSKRDLPERPGHAGWPIATPYAACIGRIHARLALMLHEPELLDDRWPIEDAADEFLVPPRGFMRRALLALPAPTRGPKLEGDGLVFSAMKPAESGKGIVLRCYNASAEAGRGAWEVGRGFSYAARCRLDETVIDKLALKDGVVRFEAAPREIVTILLR